MTMLPPSPLIPMKALKATGILLAIILSVLVVGLIIWGVAVFHVTYVIGNMDAENNLLITSVLVVLLIAWGYIYLSLE